MVSMAYRQKAKAINEQANAFLKSLYEGEDYMRKSREKAEDARARYREQVAQTGVARGLRRTRERAAIGRIRSGLSPRTRFHREENVGYNPPAGRILSRSREKYRQNTGDTSYEATQRRATATKLMKKQDNELYQQYRNQAKKKAEYERQARLDVQRNAGYMEDERNNKEKIARYNATHGGPAKQRVKVYEGGGVSAVAADNGKAALAGGALGAAGGAGAGAFGVKYGPTAKKYTGRKLIHLIRGTLPRGAQRTNAARAVVAGAKAGILPGLLRGAGAAMTAYDAYRAGKWMVDQNIKNARSNSEAHEDYKKKRRTQGLHEWDGGAR